MASARWATKTWIAPAFAAWAAACMTPAPQGDADAWAEVRRIYAGRAAAHEPVGVYGAGSGAADPLSEQARERDDWAWQSARRRDEAREYERYLREHYDGAHRMEAQRRLDQLRAGDEADWSRADLRDSIDAYQAYIANNPDGAYSDRARQRIQELRDRQFLRPLHRPYPSGMEAQPQRAPVLPSRQAPSEPLRPAPPERSAPAPATTAPTTTPLTRAAPAAPASHPAAPQPATGPFGRSATSEPASPRPAPRRAAEPH